MTKHKPIVKEPAKGPPIYSGSVVDPAWLEANGFRRDGTGAAHRLGLEPLMVIETALDEHSPFVDDLIATGPQFKIRAKTDARLRAREGIEVITEAVRVLVSGDPISLPSREAVEHALSKSLQHMFRCFRAAVTESVPDDDGSSFNYDLVRSVWDHEIAGGSCAAVEPQELLDAALEGVDDLTLKQRLDALFLAKPALLAEIRGETVTPCHKTPVPRPKGSKP